MGMAEHNSQPEHPSEVEPFHQTSEMEPFPQSHRQATALDPTTLNYDGDINFQDAIEIGMIFGIFDSRPPEPIRQDHPTTLPNVSLDEITEIVAESEVWELSEEPMNVDDVGASAIGNGMCCSYNRDRF